MPSEAFNRWSHYKVLIGTSVRGLKVFKKEGLNRASIKKPQHASKKRSSKSCNRRPERTSIKALCRRVYLRKISSKVVINGLEKASID